MRNNLLNPFRKRVIPGISLITCVKNRKATLIEAIRTWVKFDEIDEIIIVDWSSDESLIPVIEKFQNGKIFVAIVPGQDKWILSHAYNLAARLTSRNTILKIDADVKILPDFFKQHVLKPGLFYSGNWMLGRDENEKHLNGTVFLHRSNFFKVNGYNEYIKFYGWDDSDLYNRLESLNLKRLYFDLDLLQHIAHESRTALQSTAENFQNMTDIEKSNLNILTNRYLCTKLLKWSLKNKMLGFTIQVKDNNTWLCKQSSEDQNSVPAEYYLESETNAIKERLKQFGFGIHDDFDSYLKGDELIEYYNLFLSREVDKTASDLFNVISKFNYLYTATLANDKIALGKLESEINLRNDEVYKIKEELLHKTSMVDHLSEQQRLSNQIIQAKENQIKDKDLKLEQNDETILQLNQIIVGKENELTDKDLKLEQNDENIRQLNQIIVGKENALKDVNLFLEQAKVTILQLNQIIGRKENELSNKNLLLEHATLTIDQLNQIIGAKETLLLNKDKELQNNDSEIHKNKTEILKQTIFIREKENIIGQLNSQSKQQYRSIKDLEHKIEILIRNVEDREKIIASSQDQLNSIYRSYSWRTGHFIFSLLSKFVFLSKKTHH
jgi:Glycosyl transferase family 2/N-terminal domain of galactosyltransferase